MSRHRSPAIAIWLAVGMIALIAYGSLYPFNLKIDTTQSVWQWINEAFSQLSWARGGFGDRVANVLLYVPLGFCLALWFEGGMRRRAAIVMTTAAGALFSLLIELAQVFISTRVPSLWDVTFNSLGTFGGALGGLAWRALSARLPNSLAGSSRSDSSAWLVLALWFAWRWAPFEPRFNLTKLKSAFNPLFDPTWDWLVTFSYLVWWVVVAQVIFIATSAQRGVEVLLAIIAALLVGRLFVTDPVFIPDELLALVLLLPVLVLLHRLWMPTRKIIVLSSFLLVFLCDRLLGMSTSNPHFDLWPFLAWIDAGFPIQLLPLCKALCEFAALIWLLKDAGVSARVATWGVPIGVLVLEIAALWLPGRDASLTAPAIATGVAVAMYQLTDRRAAIHQRVRSR